MTERAASLKGWRGGIYFALQPVLLFLALWLWWMEPTSPAVYPLIILGVQIILGFIEHYQPARPDWVIGARQKTLNVMLVIVLTTLTTLVAELYDQVLADPLTALRASLNLQFWPHEWPLLVQVFMVFFLSEFVWYWFHRAEHRWHLVWRLSGHGAHHSFKKLGALNFGLNHPLEMFLLVLPAALVELTFGVGVATVGAAILAVTQASIAHANIQLNHRGIGLFFTTNRYHICHHSAQLEESNSNYGCSAIIWDRVFGTFLDTEIAEAGTGPTEPTLWQKFLMPVREPGDTAIAP